MNILQTIFCKTNFCTTIFCISKFLNISNTCEQSIITIYTIIQMCFSSYSIKVNKVNTLKSTKVNTSIVQVIYSYIQVNTCIYTCKTLISIKIFDKYIFEICCMNILFWEKLLQNNVCKKLLAKNCLQKYNQIPVTQNRPNSRPIYSICYYVTYWI